MFKLYDTVFKIGFWSSISIFLILNITSIILTQFGYINNNYKLIEHFNNSEGGFPFQMIDQPWAWVIVVVNITFAVFFSFVVGLIFRFGWSKFKTKQLK